MSRRTVVGACAIALVLVVAALTVTFRGGADRPTGRPGADRSGADVAGQMAARAAYDRMTPIQRVGQLFMVGVDARGAERDEWRPITRLALGNVFLRGRSSDGVRSTARLTSVLTARATRRGVRPLIGVDQEGGLVQTLSGPGFSTIPTGLAQGRASHPRLLDDARSWGRQLARAGVNLDLAPVADVVPPYVGRSNQPIGRYARELGHRARPVAADVASVVAGMSQARVATTLKHFPGLGRASGDTDASGEVTAPTTRHDLALRPFRAGIRAGADLVMVSSARYPHLDRDRIACWSPRVMRTLLRGDLGFRGVVISDSFATPALGATPPAQRALRFLRAGGTMVLDTDPADLAPMVRAVRAAAVAEPAFARTVRRAVLTVLRVKAEHGLVRR